MIVYPPCKNCGASHGMGIEDMETGDITPIDLCHTCLWRDIDKLDEPMLTQALEEDLIESMKFMEKDLFI